MGFLFEDSYKQKISTGKCEECGEIEVCVSIYELNAEGWINKYDLYSRRCLKCIKAREIERIKEEEEDFEKVRKKRNKLLKNY